jgi:PHD/YefM family antitoxin component YafN of YafNO toxin-antitoxin module
MPELDALVKEIHEPEEFEPISLERCGSQMAVIVSSAEYTSMKLLEEALLDKLDSEDSEKILKNPEWIGWDELQKQLKS